MAIIPVTTETVAEGVLFRWLGLLGNVVLADCDVGEQVALPVAGERQCQMVGALDNRFGLEFNSDPDNMPWFRVQPSSGNMLMTPGRQYSASLISVWPAARFFRPRVYSVYAPASAAIDVVVFCATGGL